MKRVLRIGTRESQLAVWQATQVRLLLSQEEQEADLIYIKSEGDLDLKTPLYEIGVQGIFTRSLDIALLDHTIDIAVHSLKDVPTNLPVGIIQAAVLERGPSSDLLVFKTDDTFLTRENYTAQIATSSIRRKAQWLHRYPNHQFHILRGNINTRLEKLATENWDAAIFAQAGLERINLRPPNSIIIHWMLPAPAQGAVVVVCRKDDQNVFEICNRFNDIKTALCTKIERDFLRSLSGGCSAPIGALAAVQHEQIYFKGNILSPDGIKKFEIEKIVEVSAADEIGNLAALELMNKGGKEISDSIRDARQ